MTRIVSALGAALTLFAPFAASAQQLNINLDPAVLQQFVQLQQGSTTVSTQLQQALLGAVPLAQTYLQTLSPSDTEMIIGRLETMLVNPKFTLATQQLGTSTNQALINTLMSQVLVLQAQIAAIIASSTPTTTPVIIAPVIPVPASAGTSTAEIACPTITRLLQVGANGTDVINLQAFLIGENLLEAGNATGYFGKLTEAAVQAWQKAKAIVTEGDAATTGFGAIGPKTRAALLNCR